MSMVTSNHLIDGMHQHAYGAIASHSVSGILPPPRSYYVVSWVPRALPEVVELIKKIPTDNERFIINKHFELGILVMRRCGVQNPEEIKCLLDGFREGTTRLASKEIPKSPMKDSNVSRNMSNENNGYCNSFSYSPTVERRKLLIFFNDHRASRPWVLCPAKHCIKSARTTGKVKGRVKILQYDQRSTTVKIPKVFIDCLSDFLTTDHYVFATFCPQQKYTDHELEWFEYSKHNDKRNDAELGGDIIFKELLEEHDTKATRTWPFEDYIIFANSQSKIVAVFKKKRPLLAFYKQDSSLLDEFSNLETPTKHQIIQNYSGSNCLIKSNIPVNDTCANKHISNSLCKAKSISNSENSIFCCVPATSKLSVSSPSKTEIYSDDQSGSKLNSVNCSSKDFERKNILNNKIGNSMTSMASMTTSVGDDDDDIENELCPLRPSRVPLKTKTFTGSNSSACSNDESHGTLDMIEDLPISEDESYTMIDYNAKTRYSCRGNENMKYCDPNFKKVKYSKLYGKHYTDQFKDYQSQCFESYSCLDDNSQLGMGKCYSMNPSLTLFPVSNAPTMQNSVMHNSMNGFKCHDPINLNDMIINESNSCIEESNYISPVEESEEAEIMLIRIMTKVLAHLEPLDDTNIIGMNRFNMETQNNDICSKQNHIFQTSRIQTPSPILINEQYNQEDDLNCIQQQIMNSTISNNNDQIIHNGKIQNRVTSTTSTSESGGVSQSYFQDCIAPGNNAESNNSCVNHHQRRKMELHNSDDSEGKRRKVLGYTQTNAILYHDLIRQFFARLAFGLDHPPLPQKRIPDTVKRVVTKIVTDSIREVNLALLTSSLRGEVNTNESINSNNNCFRPRVSILQPPNYSNYWALQTLPNGISSDGPHPNGSPLVVPCTNPIYPPYVNQQQTDAVPNSNGPYIHNTFSFSDQNPPVVSVCPNNLGISSSGIFSSPTNDSHPAPNFHNIFHSSTIEAATAAMITFSNPNTSQEILDYISYPCSQSECVNIPNHNQYLVPNMRDDTTQESKYIKHNNKDHDSLSTTSPISNVLLYNDNSYRTITSEDEMSLSSNNSKRQNSHLGIHNMNLESTNLKSSINEQRSSPSTSHSCQSHLQRNSPDAPPSAKRILELEPFNTYAIYSQDMASNGLNQHSHSHSDIATPLIISHNSLNVLQRNNPVSNVCFDFSQRVNNGDNNYYDYNNVSRYPNKLYRDQTSSNSFTNSFNESSLDTKSFDNSMNPQNCNGHYNEINQSYDSCHNNSQSNDSKNIKYAVTNFKKIK